jgi:hypothetical protein
MYKQKVLSIALRVDFIIFRQKKKVWNYAIHIDILYEEF